MIKAKLIKIIINSLASFLPSNTFRVHLLHMTSSEATLSLLLYSDGPLKVVKMLVKVAISFKYGCLLCKTRTE